MNKDTFWNVTIGLLSTVLIGGGAYLMATGGIIKKQQADNQFAAIETSKSDDSQNTEKQDDKKEVEKSEVNNLTKSNNMTKDGMLIEIKKEGDGDGVKTGQVAVVHYTGMFTDGKVFDSSVPRGQTFPVQLGAGMVIKGWEEGLVGMKKGELRRLTIPPQLAYGERGAGGVIPPNSTLIFDIELVDIK